MMTFLICLVCYLYAAGALNTAALIMTLKNKKNFELSWKLAIWPVILLLAIVTFIYMSLGGKVKGINEE